MKTKDSKQQTAAMFRSPNSRQSPRIPKHQIPDGPIQDFTTIIEKTVPEDWQKRTAALNTLVASIPSGSDYYNSAAVVAIQGNAETWYNSPPVLRHLAIPLSELLKDARSTVVKRTCESCTELFAKCQVDARYLLKDIMPAILQVHASTVQVIRTYVQVMVIEAIAVVPCKMTMPMWLDGLKNDKSRTVREACCLYLSKAIEEWSTLVNETYLTKDIYIQVGTVFLKALRDASPQVRQQSRKGLEVIYGIHPHVFDMVVANDWEATRDVRVKKLVQKIQAGEAVGDDVSVSSRSSVVSRSRSVASAPARGYRAGSRAGTNLRSSTTNRTNTTTTTTTSTAFNNSQRHRRVGSGPGDGYVNKAAIPTTIGVSSKLSTTGTGLGPPRRVVATSNGGNDSSNMGLGPLRREVTTFNDSVSNDINDNSTSSLINAFNLSASDGITPSNEFRPEKDITTANPPLQYPVEETPLPPKLPNEDTANGGNALVPLNPEDRNQSFDTNETEVSELQPITSTTELREVAKSRGITSRRSSLLQDRLMRSSTVTDSENGGEDEQDPSSSIYLGDDPVKDSNNKTVITSMMDVAHLSEEEIANHPNLPEHIKIAHQLLEAHKVHVDQVMEVLKVEMDALKDFELILLEEGPRRPTEEEVLEYFESLGLCLEQRAKAGQILQKKMDRISRGN